MLNKFSQNIIWIFFQNAPRKFSLIILLLIIASILEGFSIVSILPILTLYSGEESLESSKFFSHFQKIANFFNLEPDINFFLLIILIGISIKFVFMFFSLKLSVYAAAQFSDIYRKKLLNCFIKLKWSYFISKKTGRFTNSILNEATQVGGGHQTVVNFISMFLQIITFLILSMIISWEITIVAIIFSLLIFLLLSFFVSLSKKFARHHVEVLNTFSSSIIDIFQMIKPIRAMGQEHHFLNQLKEISEKVRNIQKKLSLTGTYLATLQEPIFIILVCIGLITYLNFFNEMYSLTNAIIIILLFYRIYTKGGNLLIALQKIVICEGAFNSLTGLLDEAKKNQEFLNEDKLLPSYNGDLSFKNVSFSYSKKKVFENLSFKFELRKKIIGISGQSGEGKSTLIDLIIGLQNPDEGKVLICGEDLKNINHRTWRENIGFVPQDVILFNDSVKNNVTLYDNKFNDDEINDCLKGSGVFEDIKELVGDIHYNVGEKGYRLSGGQRQRIIISRALIRKPQILIFDEPTAALDLKNKKKIIKTIKTLSKNITILTASHDKLLLDECDFIIDLNQKE